MSAIEAARSLRKGRGDRSVADLLQEKPDVLVGARTSVSDGLVSHATLLRIEGRYEGTVPSTVGDVIIGEHGELVGSVRGARACVVLGKVHGSVHSKFAHLGARATIVGDLVTDSLSTASSSAARAPVIVGGVISRPGAFDELAARQAAAGGDDAPAVPFALPTAAEEAASAARLAPPALIVGTLNLISEDYNPWQFEPPAKRATWARALGASVRAESDDDLRERWDGAKARARRAFDRFDVRSVLDALDAAELRAAADANARGDAASETAIVAHAARARKWVDEQHFEHAQGLAALAAGKKLDLSLDNKWAPEANRLNPLVFGLAPVEAGESPSADGETQLEACRRDADGFAARVLSVHAARFGVLAADDEAAALGLLLWDLLCVGVYASAADTFDLLARASHLVADVVSDRPSGDVGHAARPRPRARDETLAAILRPVLDLAARHPSAPLVVGCQEMPKSRACGHLRALAARPLSGRAGRAAIEIAPPADDLPDSYGTGWIFRNVSHEDVTARVASVIRRCLETTCPSVPPKVRETTLRKLVVGRFRSTSAVTGKDFVCINMHCKSFSSATRCQAEFVAAAARAVAEALAESADAELPHVTVVGDFNIDTKWGKIDATAQAEALASVPVGELPAAPALKREGLETFCATLSAAGALFEPPLATLTTLKQRTRFQGQPHKAGELTVAHKDFVILPSPAKLRVRDVVLGGMPDPAARGANAVMALLQPSYEWPGDHAAVLCLLG